MGGRGACGEATDPVIFRDYSRGGRGKRSQKKRARPVSLWRSFATHAGVQNWSGSFSCTSLLFVAISHESYMTYMQEA